MYKNEQYCRYLAVIGDTEKLPLEDKNLDKLSSLVHTPSVSANKLEEMEAKETEEFLAKGRLSKSVYIKYFIAGTSVFRIIILIFFFLTTQLSISGFDYWLSFW